MNPHPGHRACQFVAAMALCSAAVAQDSAYTVDVWARVTFDASGRAVSYQLIDEEKYPQQFAESVLSRVAKARIPPPTDHGAPATLATGVRLAFSVTPGVERASVRLTGLAMGPLPIQQYYASYPDDVGAAGGWQGDVEASCRVATSGQCEAIDVKALPGIPASVRRWAKVSLAGWRFQPEELNGRPIPGEYTLRARLETLDATPEDFRKDKFLRSLQGK